MRMTPAQMAAKILALKAANSPEIIKAMDAAGLNVVGVAKEYCTPGKSPYWKAPYSDDQLRGRQDEHMRDLIENTVVPDGDTIHGIVFVRDSAEGQNHRYALYVHTGTYDYATTPDAGIGFGYVEGMKGMPPRPVIPDAVKQCERETLSILAKGVHEHIKWVNYGGGYVHPSSEGTEGETAGTDEGSPEEPS